MFKVVLLLRRSPALSAVGFADEWAGAWRKLTAAAGLVRHIHNRPLDDEMPIENVAAATFDAMDEFWFDDQAAAVRYFAHDLGPATASPLRLAAPPFSALAGEPRLAWSREVVGDETPVKVVTLPVRRPGMAWDAFYAHWTEQHWPLAVKGPQAPEALVRVDMCGARSDPPAGLVAAPFDGVGTIVFRSLAAMQQQFSTAYYRDVLAPDELRFTDPALSRGLLVRETPIFERPLD